ncbi:hypothetical protein [Nonomuraea phyllanthi]|uniref:hypothetical protein n=1 Tax=Nonomuraea phyllanthi TaxID=2219224 RepID=UPI00186B1C18|nr:hypothetical protein [Nonomuraea phyllanthi]
MLTVALDLRGEARGDPDAQHVPDALVMVDRDVDPTILTAHPVIMMERGAGGQ